VPESGESLAGQPISAEAIERAAKLAQAAARPISDMRGTADYRKHLCAVLTRRTLEQAIARAKAG
jgi:carbon-monoxide dehydrogenase medium subunit